LSNEATKTNTDTKLDLDEPKRYKVFLLNDDYTTMDFVVDILMKIFYKSYNEAVDIMINIHKNGKGLCGEFPYEIAEVKTLEVKNRARDRGFPLRAVIEK